MSWSHIIPPTIFNNVVKILTGLKFSLRNTSSFLCNGTTLPHLNCSGNIDTVRHWFITAVRLQLKASLPSFISSVGIRSLPHAFPTCRPLSYSITSWELTFSKLKIGMFLFFHYVLNTWMSIILCDYICSAYVCYRGRFTQIICHVHEILIKYVAYVSFYTWRRRTTECREKRYG